MIEYLKELHYIAQSLIALGFIVFMYVVVGLINILLKKERRM